MGPLPLAPMQATMGQLVVLQQQEEQQAPGVGAWDTPWGPITALDQQQQARGLVGEANGGCWLSTRAVTGPCTAWVGMVEGMVRVGTGRTTTIITTWAVPPSSCCQRSLCRRGSGSSCSRATTSYSCRCVWGVWGCLCVIRCLHVATGLGKNIAACTCMCVGVSTRGLQHVASNISPSHNYWAPELCLYTWCVMMNRHRHKQTGHA